MNDDATFRKLLQSGQIRMSAASESEPSRVVEVEGVLFNLKDIVALQRCGIETLVFLRGAAMSIALNVEFEKFKELIGARPEKLEVADED